MPLNTDTIRAGASGATSASASFYTKTVSQSLRFNDDDSAYLARTPSSSAASSGNKKVWTWSAWIKKTQSSSTDGVLFSANGGGDTWFLIGYSGSNTGIDVDWYNGSTRLARKFSTQVFRDPSAWYNVVVSVNVSNSTPADRIKIFINGVRLTGFSPDTDPPDSDTYVNSANLHAIGKNASASRTSYFDGYLADVYLIDGVAVDDTNSDGYVDEFGELKNGVWIPKAYTGSFGTNGFYLTFQNSSNIGYDYQTSGRSGTTNDFTPYNVTAVDVMPDSPTNNFCVMNSQGRRYGQSYVGTFSEGNLKVVHGGNATNFFGTMPINQVASQGGVYFEIRLDSIDVARCYFGLVGDDGIAGGNSNANSGGYLFPLKAMLNDDPRAYFVTDVSSGGSLDLTANPAFGDNDVCGIAVLSDGKFFAHRNGTYLQNTSGNVGNPSTGANPIDTIDLTSTQWFPYLGYKSSFTINFGQDGTFNGNETPAGTYTDSNGIGNFNYPVPTNCLALCTSNMEEPTIGPNSTTQADDHFNISLYQGNETAGNTGSGLGFQPDWLIFKNRDNGDYWRTYDSTRGTEKSLAPNDNDAEVSSDGGVTSFTSPANDGFTIGATSYVNRNNNAYVAWAWKANGNNTSTIAADSVSSGVPSVASTVQANTDAGFSIVTFPANNTNGTKVAHGLGSIPKMIITKQRPAISSWYVYHNAIGNDRWLRWNNPNSEGERTTNGSTAWGGVTPDANTFTIGNNTFGYNNGGANDVVAYVFAEKNGYSKFGSFVGNGESTDGTFIHLGFRPRLFMMFLISSGSLHLWFWYDTKRGAGNQPINPEIYFSDDSYDLETSFVFGDFNSNGIKIRNGNSARNPSAGEFIYMAFAENPFKYANAR